MKELNRTLFMRRGGHSFDMERGYKHTKVTNLRISREGKLLYETNATTWASVVRDVIDVIRPSYQNLVENGTFEARFNLALSNYLTEHNFAPNANFSTTIFTTDDWMTSSLYKGSKNHTLFLFKDVNTLENKYICAVYADETVWVMQALLNTLDENYTVEITYIPRNPELNVYVHGRNPITEGEHLSKAFGSFEKESFTKDMLCLQFEISNVQAQVMKLYNMTTQICEKYGLNPQDYLDTLMGMDKYKDKALDSTDNPF